MHLHDHKLCSAHACGALPLVGGCTGSYNNVGGVTAGQAPRNSSNVGVEILVMINNAIIRN